MNENLFLKLFGEALQVTPGATLYIKLKVILRDA